MVEWPVRVLGIVLGGGVLAGGVALIVNFRGLATYLAHREQGPWTRQGLATTRSMRLGGVVFAVVGAGVLAVAIHGRPL